MSKVKLLLDVMANLVNYDTGDDAPPRVHQRVQNVGAGAFVLSSCNLDLQRFRIHD